jgi:hypothetical protein
VWKRILRFTKKRGHIALAAIAVAAGVLLAGYLGQQNHPTLVLQVVGTVKSTESAASLQAVPADHNLKIGETIEVMLTVDSVDQSINAIGGTVTYATDTLEVVSISASSSVVDLWIQQPAESYETGSIPFSGVIKPPGFFGVGGEVFKLFFRSKQEGTAIIDIKQPQVLADDGQGTAIPTTVQPAMLNILVTQLSGTADIDRDGKVDFTDLSILMANWGTPKNLKADLNGDGIVDIKDLSILLSKIIGSH